ncbi:MAG TPA: protein kinase [Anaerolineales bacterium]|nr:protein kinase [Anaerolineales bacterium]
MPEWIGKTVGKVRIEQEIAKGGMAEVYLGTHLTLDRLVAVKVMHSFIETDPELQSRFEREAKVVAGLRHSNIVQIFDFDTADGHPYIVMEYLKGPTLASYLRELHNHKQRLQPQQVARLLITIATALDYAHEKGVIHRDIKPGNIILHNKNSDFSVDQPITEQTEPVLTDFGLVRIAQAVTQTASGSVSGTPAYMSPEQAQGLKVDRRSDIYSLGVILYEMVAGRVPFEGDTSWTVIFKHINEPPPPVANIQPPVQKVIDRALAKNPEDRYQTARALAADYMDAIGMIAEANTLRMSLSSSRTPQAATISQKGNQASAPAWTRIALFIGVGVLVVVLAMFSSSRVLSPGQSTSVLTAIAQSTEVLTTDQSPTEANAVLPLQVTKPVGLLRFQDGTAPADAVTISTDTMPPPPQGSQYEAWLIQDDGEQRISIGTIVFNQQGKGSLTFVDNNGGNLLGKYSALEITVEPDPDSNPNSSNNIAYSVRLPEGGLTHVRHLLYSFGGTPNQIGFIRGLDADTNLLNESAKQMLSDFESGNDTDVLLQAENMLNLIVGDQSADHKDWNGNGTVEDPSDGYGLLLNGDNLGYIQGSYTHADLAITSPDATQNMLMHGEHVKICAQNISDWTAKLRDQLVAIIEKPTDPNREGLIRQAVAIANQIRVGFDVNGDEKIDPIPGEGGALTAYEHAYYMADMLILPAANQTPTP